MSNIYSKLGIDIEKAKNNPKVIELLNIIQSDSLDVSMLNEKSIDDILSCLLIVAS